MARIVQAINVYGPKLELNPTAQLDQVVAWMAMRTGVNKSEVSMILQEISEAILYFNSRGTPVKLPGVGIFIPYIDREGHLRITFRADRTWSTGINAPGAYTGPVRNENRIGLDDAGYKAVWDPDHPDDPLDI